MQRGDKQTAVLIAVLIGVASLSSRCGGRVVAIRRDRSGTNDAPEACPVAWHVEAARG